MNVRLVGEWATALGIEPNAETATPPSKQEFAGGELNERQQWVLAKVEDGERLRLKDVLDQFRGECNRSTINRELKRLRETGLLVTLASGYYGCGPAGNSAGAE